VAARRIARNAVGDARPSPVETNLLLEGGGRLEQDENDGHGREGKLRIARLTALLQEFELHLRKKELERARDRLATITTTLALALTDAQKRLANTR
jgi:hypothetical protein